MPRSMPHSQLVGILNVTPDSFSDGGEAFSEAAAIQKFEQLVNDGADIVDIGAESTRPGATPISPDEEWQRLAPLLRHLQIHPLRKKVQISIDTRHAKTAENAIGLHVDIINDVNGLNDPAMHRVLAASDVRIVAMHSLSVPADKSIVLDDGVDVVEVIRSWQAEKMALAESNGIHPERIIWDPGIGFGKTAAQSLQLMARMDDYCCPPKNWLIGHSRKSFLSLIDNGNRDSATIMCSVFIMGQGIGYLRVHDVAAHAELRRVLA
jgi:dihydropteroate synthase